ncbi:hypothetical protein [Streptomyces sp. NBC_01197]|uniref:hypothetical protein n=1 Tax=Streptomyces sp. NBC_01197 TaxID=2903768 RepID=UPI002E1070E1|nr:hypothetical protein OG452_34990 [Streptomyces sp. NBC_01197]
MAELEYFEADELPADLQKRVFRDRNELRWKLAALVVYSDRESGRSTERVAFLRREDSSGGLEWEIPLTSLYKTAEVER